MVQRNHQESSLKITDAKVSPTESESLEVDTSASLPYGYSLGDSYVGLRSTYLIMIAS